MTKSHVSSLMRPVASRLSLNRLALVLVLAIVTAQAQGEPTVNSVVAEVTAAGRGLTESEQQEATGLVLIGLKEEQQLEVWLVAEDESSRRIRNYPFTATSGKLGPKLREGDRQIPEGDYRVVYLNPQSSYHLSFKISYPNDFDQKKGEEDGRTKLGDDIFIHGKAVTIGCIPIGDEAIEDLFTMVAQVGKGNVRVLIAPWDFRKREDLPEIKTVSWEADLYALLREEMEAFRIIEDGE